MEKLYHNFQDFIGEGDAGLTLVQILIRTVLVFILSVILIRLSDRRSYSLLLPFENVIIFLHGAILGRMILDPDNPFLPSFLAALLISQLHRFTAFFAMKSEFMGTLVKGKPIVLFENGEMFVKNMKRANISPDDLEEGARKHASVNSLESIEKATLERDGNISFIRKESGS
jgi:uncharacterized membrane protein YcaP (DUF421 family)